MTLNNYYTFKDIVMGSRNEYLKVQEKLKELKNYSEWDNSKVDDIYYNLEYGNTRGYNTTDISCNIIEKLNYLEKLLVRNKKYEYLKQPERGIITRNNSGDFYILNDKNKIDITNNEEFANIYYYLLNSDFIKKIDFGSIKGKDSLTNIFVNNIVLQEKIFNYFVKMNYIAKDDIIEVSSSKISIDENLINLLINTTIPSNNLSDYHKKIIDRSYSTIKPINVDILNSEDNVVRLKIDEKDDNITLRKIYK